MLLWSGMAGSTTPINSAITQLVGQDTELADKARALANKAIDAANEYLDFGTDRHRMDVIKSLMPAIGRGMTDKGESEQLTELREEVRSLMQMMTGDTDVA